MAETGADLETAGEQKMRGIGPNAVVAQIAREIDRPARRSEAAVCKKRRTERSVCFCVWQGKPNGRTAGEQKMLYRILLSRPGPAVGVLAAVTLSWALVGWLLIELVRWAAFALN